MIIFIPIEVSLREKIHKIFLAYQILKYTNFKVIIGGQRFLNKKIKKFKNCIYLDKGTFFERLKIDKSNYVISLDEEGPISFYQDFGETMYSQNYIGLIDSIILWGKKDFKKILRLKNSSINIKTFGHPKFDLLKKKYVNIFNKEVNIIKKKYKDFVFIPGSGSLESHTNLESAYTKIWVKKTNIKKKIAAEQIKYRNLEKENYINFLKFIKKLAVERPNVIFIFRKHPTEDEKNLFNVFGTMPKNLILINKFTVTPWIIACNYYLHSGCTTSIEARILKKKIILYSTKVLSKNPRFKAFKFSNRNFTNEKKCLLFFKNIKKQKFIYKTKDISSIIYNHDKKVLFFKKFIQFIKKINLKEASLIEYRKQNHNKLFKLFYAIRNIIFKILSFVKNNIFIGTFLIKYLPEKHLFGKKAALRKFTNLKKSEINNFIMRLNNINKTKINPKITKISNSVYKLEKK